MVETTPKFTKMNNSNVWEIPDEVRAHCGVNIYTSTAVWKAYPSFLKFDYDGNPIKSHIDIQMLSLSLIMSIIKRIDYYHTQNALLATCGIKELIDNVYTKPDTLNHFLTTELCAIMTRKVFTLPYQYIDTHIMKDAALYHDDFNVIRDMVLQDHDDLIKQYHHYTTKVAHGFTLTLLNRFDKFEIVIAAKMGSHVTDVERYDSDIPDDMAETPPEERIHTTIGAYTLTYYTPKPLSKKSVGWGSM